MRLTMRRRTTRTWSVPGAAQAVTTTLFLILRAKRATLTLIAFQRDGVHIMMEVRETLPVLHTVKDNSIVLGSLMNIL
jgi:hypothetical protein